MISETAWERGLRERGWPQVTKFKAIPQVLSFGDGTGYWGTELYPPPGRRKAVTNNSKPPQLPKSRPRRGPQSKIASTFKQPVFMPANFLSSESVVTATTSAASHLSHVCFPCVPPTTLCDEVLLPTGFARKVFFTTIGFFSQRAEFIQTRTIRSYFSCKALPTLIAIATNDASKPNGTTISTSLNEAP